MSRKIYTPSLQALLYVGETPRIIREVIYFRGEKVVTLEKGDIIIVPLQTAMLMKKKQPAFFELVSDLSDEVEPRLDNFSEAVKEEAEIKEEVPVPVREPLNLSNLDDYTTDELIAFAKEKKVVGMNKKAKREDVIPKILPFLT